MYTPLTLIVKFEGASVNDLNCLQIGSESRKLTPLKWPYKLVNESAHESVETSSISVSITIDKSGPINVSFQ